MLNLQPKYGTLEMRRNVASYLFDASGLGESDATPEVPIAELLVQDGAEPSATEEISAQKLHRAAINLVLLVMHHPDIKESELGSYGPDFKVLYEFRKEENCNILTLAACIGENLTPAGIRELDLSSLKLNPEDPNGWIAFCELLNTSSLTTLILHPEDCNTLFTNAQLHLFGAIETSGIIRMNVDAFKLPEEQRDELKRILCGNIVKRFQEISQTGSKEEKQALIKLYFEYHIEHQQVPRPIVRYNVANYLEEATDKHQAALNLVLLIIFPQGINENTDGSTYFNNLLQIRLKKGCDTHDFAECIGIEMAGSELDLSSLLLEPSATYWIAFCCFFKVSSFTTLKLQLVNTYLFIAHSWDSFCDATKISSITGLNVDDFKLPREQSNELKQILCAKNFVAYKMW